MKKFNSKFFNIGTTTFVFAIANKNTCWWSNVKTKKSRQRKDILFGLTRTLMRESKKYIYRVILGRFVFGWIN